MLEIKYVKSKITNVVNELLKSNDPCTRRQVYNKLSSMYNDLEEMYSLQLLEKSKNVYMDIVSFVVLLIVIDQSQ